ncbi:MAG: hypothetical protein IJX38_00735 [Clostridia bacterium]|nr:hypothetical protein [Clostridia bacterium]
MKLSGIFTSGAVYLQNSSLVISGDAVASARVTVTLTRDADGATVGCSGYADENGTFAIEIFTPPASFDTYTVSVNDGEDNVTLTDVLFGEVWLCAGQSNMELHNATHEECEAVIDSLSGKNIRIHYVRPLDPTEPHYFDPLRCYDGIWVHPSDRKNMRRCSALGTAFASDLYDYFSAKSDVPVGIISAGRGAATLEAFLSKEIVEASPVAEDYMRRNGLIPDRESWDKDEKNRVLQAYSAYNYMISPLRGLRFRGMVWYQGESNTHREPLEEHYAMMMKALGDGYKKLFAPKSAAEFPIITCQIYPYPYAESGSCRIAPINAALATLSVESTEYPTVPTANLPWRWNYNANMHPIHPTHKYALGKTVAEVAKRTCYGKPTDQRCPARAVGFRREGNRIIVDFSDTGTGIYIDGSFPRGLYIRSERGAYTPAKCEILGKDSIAVYHEGLREPAFVSYGISDMETELNLYAGDFAVVPFSNEVKGGTQPPTVQLKAWLDTSIDSVMLFDSFTDESQDMFPHPVFYPLCGSTLCFDSAFNVSGRSLRIHGEPSHKGFYIESKKYREIDLENYVTLGMYIGHTDELTAKMTIYTIRDGKERTSTVTGRLDRPVGVGLGFYKFDIPKLSDPVTRVEFVFVHDGETPRDRYAVIDGITLTPKR